MSWFLLAFEKHGNALKSEVELPECIDDDVVKSLVGDYPNLRADSFPVEGQKLASLGRLVPFSLDSEALDYFIEYYE